MNYKQFRLYYNFISTSADVQTYICIFSNEELNTLDVINNFYLSTRPTDDIFLKDTDLIVSIDIKHKNKASQKDQQKLLNKIQEFYVTYPELFI